MKDISRMYTTHKKSENTKVRFVFYSQRIYVLILGFCGSCLSCASFLGCTNSSNKNQNMRPDAGAVPAPLCGNGITEPGETCDGTDLNDYTCETVAVELSAGTLVCRDDCTGYDISLCEVANDTIDASSCEQQDVQAAIDTASDGDTVTIPAGECTWSSPVDCDGRTDCAPIHITAKSITLLGAGIGETVIQSDVPEGWQYSTLFIDTIPDHPVRISGLTINEIVAPAITVGGTTRNWRIDHCAFFPASADGVVAIEVIDRAFGVVDHCAFTNAEILVLGDEDAAWSRPLTLGTAKAVYIEDCTFGNNDVINDVVDGRSGARFVFRYNTLTNLELHCHGIEGGGARSTHSYEFYGNTGICDGTVNCYRIAYLRGGTGVIFDNSWTGDWNRESGLQIVHQCAYRDNCTGFKACTQYPCHDQIGRTTDHDGDGVQDLVPLFEWNNTLNGDDIDLTVQADTHPEMTEYIKINRDFYNDTVTLSPTTATYDASYLDHYGDTRTFRYVPFVYPHPLVHIDESLNR
jgi:hypothetical protein